MMKGVTRIFEQAFSVLRVLFIWIIALFLPRMFVWYSHQTQRVQNPSSKTASKLDLENVPPVLVQKLKASEKKPATNLAANQAARDKTKAIPHNNKQVAHSS